MFGSKILELVLGLVFIFLLYSLLASSIQELMSNIYCLRSKMLRQSIRRMLIDDHKYPWYIRIVHDFRHVLCSIYPRIEKIWPHPTDFSTVFYSQPGIKYLGFNKKVSNPAYIKSETFSKTILDILKKNGEGEDDKAKITNTLEKKTVIHNGITINLDEETISHIQTIWETSEQNVEVFKKTLTNWFDETMELLTFHYKKHTRMNLFFIGLALAFIFNINTLTIANNLSKDDKARTELVALSTAYLQNAEQKDTTQTLDTGVKTFNDTLRKQIKTVYSQIQNEVYNSNNFIAIGWKIPQTYEKCRVKDSLHIRQRRDANFDIVLWKMYKKKKKECTDYNEENKLRIGNKELTKRYFPADLQLTNWEKFLYLLHMTCDIRYIIGYLITGFAISFGAPFWFDLLSKVVKIKNTVKEQEEKK